MEHIHALKVVSYFLGCHGKFLNCTVSVEREREREREVHLHSQPWAWRWEGEGWPGTGTGEGRGEPWWSSHTPWQTPCRGSEGSPVCVCVCVCVRRGKQGWERERIKKYNNIMQRIIVSQWYYSSTKSRMIRISLQILHLRVNWPTNSNNRNSSSNFQSKHPITSISVKFYSRFSGMKLDAHHNNTKRPHSQI